MKTGILLIQLGTPDAPTRPALKRYLRHFLSDPRVIDVPRWKWWFILNLFILNTRPRQSAAKYARIWDPVTGSPLLHYTRRQAELLHVAVFAEVEQDPALPEHLAHELLRVQSASFATRCQSVRLCYAPSASFHDCFVATESVATSVPLVV